MPILKRLCLVSLASVLLAAALAAAQTTSQGTVQVDVANVREGAGTQYPVVGQLKQGTGVLILGQTGSWYEIRSADGRLSGFVQFRLVRPTGTGPPPVAREIPRYQFSPRISPDQQYLLKNYADWIAQTLRRKIIELTPGVEGEVDFDGADFRDLGFAFWDTNEYQMFELLVPLTDDSFLGTSSLERVGSGYVFGPQTSALVKNMVQLVQEAYLAAEGRLARDDNNIFFVRRFAQLTQVTYVNRRGEQIGFLRPFDTSMTYFNQPFYVFFQGYEDSVNLNPGGETIQFSPEAGGRIAEMLKGAYPRGARLR
jgi:hypothetical protein